MRIEECIICKGTRTVNEDKCYCCNGIGQVFIDDEICPVLILPEKEQTFDDMFPDYPIMPSKLLPENQPYHDPCAGCSNNPRNNPHASGMCNCSLPYMNRPTY